MKRLLDVISNLLVSNLPTAHSIQGLRTSTGDSHFWVKIDVHLAQPGRFMLFK